MWAHQVIDAINARELRFLGLRAGSLEAAGLWKLCDNVAALIPCAHHFHFGCWEVWDNHDLKQTAIEFAKGERLVLPFSPAWVDGTLSGCPLAAMLDYDEAGHVAGFVFGRNRLGHWWTSGFTVALNPEEGVWEVSTDVPESDAHDRDTLVPFHCAWLWIIVSGVAALSAAGVSFRVVDPSGKLNKRRAKRGKAPAFSYRELIVDVPGHEPAALGSSAPGRLGPRLHWVRGHLRRRPGGSESAPKTVVVRPGLRGVVSAGFSEKDYAVRGGIPTPNNAKRRRA